jgi:hypothetical protein
MPVEVVGEFLQPLFEAKAGAWNPEPGRNKGCDWASNRNLLYAFSIASRNV